MPTTTPGYTIYTATPAERAERLRALLADMSARNRLREAARRHPKWLF